MEDVKFIVKTKLEKKDYRKFLYITTFFKNKIIIPYILFLCLCAALFVGFQNSIFKLSRFIIIFIICLVATIGVLILELEVKIKTRMATDKVGTFNNESKLEFYDDRVVMENEVIKLVSEIKYEQYYYLIESKAYYYFYLSKHQAYIVRKIDIENINEFSEFIKTKFNKRYKYINA